jgi:hypothetical protein
MIELATTKHHHRLLHVLATAAGLSLGLALIDFCDAWFRQWLQRNAVYWSALSECIRAQIDKPREPIIFIRQHRLESVGAAVRRSDGLLQRLPPNQEPTERDSYERPVSPKREKDICSKTVAALPS